MTCSVPICFLIHRTMADGSEGLLMAPDLPTALADVARAGVAWTAQRITLGKDTVLEGDALVRAAAERPLEPCQPGRAETRPFRA